jgi:hypothetical protein
MARTATPQTPAEGPALALVPAKMTMPPATAPASQEVEDIQVKPAKAPSVKMTRGKAKPGRHAVKRRPQPTCFTEAVYNAVPEVGMTADVVCEKMVYRGERGEFFKKNVGSALSRMFKAGLLGKRDAPQGTGARFIYYRKKGKAPTFKSNAPFKEANKIVRNRHVEEALPVATARKPAVKQTSAKVRAQAPTKVSAKKASGSGIASDYEVIDVKVKIGNQEFSLAEARKIYGDLSKMFA